MSYKVVPEVRTKFCDRCGCEDAFGPGTGQGTSPFAHKYGVLNFALAALSFGGDWGGYSQSFDLCGPCTTLFQAFMRPDMWTDEGLREGER